MKKAFRKSLKRQATTGYFGGSLRRENKSDSRLSTRRQIVVAPLLWQTLSQKYQFNLPQDWYKIEAHWIDQIESFQEQPIDCPGRDIKMNNAITRISQCNESYQLCNSLPRSFIVPKDLKDFTLMNAMSTVINNHRVPVITYCCPIEYRRNFIIRCASSDQQVKIFDILSKVVKPLQLVDLAESTPAMEAIKSSHKKLLESCKQSDMLVPTRFVARTGKWLNIVSQTLKIVKHTANIVSTKASILLIEEDDGAWNNLIASLIQIILEPHRRTMNGLESLISKEWIYLSGGQPDSPTASLLFALFLDCIYQIYLQNPTRFEFTSEYLRYLYEAQYKPSAPAMADSYATRATNSLDDCVDSKTLQHNGFGRPTLFNEEAIDVIESEPSTYKSNSMSMVEIDRTIRKSLLIDNNNLNEYSRDDGAFEIGYSIHMLNPFYRPELDPPCIDVHDHVMNMRLWSSLYLKWLPNVNYGCLEEKLFIQLQSMFVADTDVIK